MLRWRPGTICPLCLGINGSLARNMRHQARRGEHLANVLTEIVSGLLVNFEKTAQIIHESSMTRARGTVDCK